MILTLLLFSLTYSADTAVHQAARANDIKAMKAAIIKQGMDKNEIGNGGQTPIMAACLAGADKTVRWLLDFEADITIPEKDGYTCIHGVGFQGRPDTADFLLGRGIKDSQHEDGYYGFHRACWGNEERHAETVQVFLNHGTAIDLRARDGRTC